MCSFHLFGLPVANNWPFCICFLCIYFSVNSTSSSLISPLSSLGSDSIPYLCLLRCCGARPMQQRPLLTQPSSSISPSPPSLTQPTHIWLLCFLLRLRQHRDHQHRVVRPPLHDPSQGFFNSTPVWVTNDNHPLIDVPLFSFILFFVLFVLLINVMDLFGFFVVVVFLNLSCFEVHKLIWILEDLKFEINWLRDLLILS